ncbi:CBS domain-containing protein [Lentzea nigeriaca]|uniref:CBS domain-containing protein n=1 Tax=Lentzea nigeriaca TaxID=1128665 RepID=UPI00195B4384|nr:CBS domain-containing protein [Lentzea nigeriaca]MBM7863854.1 acetoin utilization protein AcuB [Lentzea nigeriaca]
MKAREVVVRPLVSVGPRDFARHAEGLMDDFGFTMLPVIDEGGVFLGVVTKSGCVLGRNGVESPHVEHVMSQPKLTAGPDMDAETLFSAMSLYEVLCVPVLDQGRVIGMVTRRDVLEALSHDDPHLRAGHAGHHG